MKNNFIQRTVTGALFVIVLVGCTLLNPMSFTLLFTLITALSIFEFGRLMNKDSRATINRMITSLAGAYLFLAMTSYCTLATDARVFIPYVGLLMYLMISELYRKADNPLNNLAFTMLSQLYIALPFSLLNLLAFRIPADQSSVIYQPLLPLAVFVFIWLSDTGAYCVGSLLGKHRLFERISPKKSWEGSIGGAIFAVIAALIFSHCTRIPLPEAQTLTMNTWHWVGLALIVVVFGTWGDLTESLIKRQLGIKDSGNILPGHGGMLDRFDSALMAIPASVLYLYILTF